MGFLDRTGAEIGCKLDKKCKEIIFIIEKIQKYRKCPALEVAEFLFRHPRHQWANTNVPPASRKVPSHRGLLGSRAGPLRYFLGFFIQSTSFFKTYSLQSISTPVLLKKPTPSLINLIENYKKSFFIIGKIQNYRKCPALTF